MLVESVCCTGVVVLIECVCVVHGCGVDKSVCCVLYRGCGVDSQHVCVLQGLWC